MGASTRPSLILADPWRVGPPGADLAWLGVGFFASFVCALLSWLYKQDEFKLLPGSSAPLVGALAKVVKLESLPNGELVVVVRALARLRVTDVVRTLPFVAARCTLYNHPEELRDARPLSQFAVGRLYHKFADEHSVEGTSDDIDFALRHNVSQPVL